MGSLVKKIGLVSLDHENVKNGKWVHQNTGRPKSKGERMALRVRCTGRGNPNFSGITNADYIAQTAEFVKQNNGEYSRTKYREYCVHNDLRFIAHFSNYRFSGSRAEFKRKLKEYCTKHGIKLNDNGRNKWA